MKTELKEKEKDIDKQIANETKPETQQAKQSKWSTDAFKLIGLTVLCFCIVLIVKLIMDWI